ncbi:DUF1642 domain-containing protein [Listeria monocytogenes]|nr:DUF1642 domain-containing protein [Listeria monocytogenes]
MKFKKGDRVEVILQSELHQGLVVEVIELTDELTDELMVRLDKQPLKVNYLFNQNQVRKVKLVKVPKFVADWIEYCEKYYWELSKALRPTYEDNCMPKEVTGWFEDCRENQELFARAWLDGYEVEQEPLFIMPVPYSVLPVHYYINRLDEISFKQGNAQKFTWNEIEKYFPEITKYAVKVKEVTE